MCLRAFISWTYFFSYPGFLSQTFTIHRTAGEAEGYLFDSSLHSWLLSSFLLSRISSFEIFAKIRLQISDTSLRWRVGMFLKVPFFMLLRVHFFTNWAKNGTFKNILTRHLKDISDICSPILANIWNEEILINKDFVDKQMCHLFLKER